MASRTSYKKSYRCFPSLQQFYTGGPFAVSSDGSFIVCACDDKIKIIDASNALIKSTIEGDSEFVTALALSPDDKLVFSSSHSRQIRVWDVSSSKCLRSWKGHEGSAMGMACDASGGLLATAGADRKVLVWDVDGGFCTHYFKGHKGVITSIMFHPDPEHLILFSGSDDGTVRVWDLMSKKCVAVLEKHFSAVTSLAISENGPTLLTAGRDKARLTFLSFLRCITCRIIVVVNLWDLHNYSFKMTVPTYEVLETVCAINTRTRLASIIGSNKMYSGKKKSSGSPPIYFLTVGEHGIVRIWNSEGAVCIFEQQSSDATVTSDNDDTKRGFGAAVMLPLDQGLLCVTVDQQFLFYSPLQSLEEKLELILSKRLVGFNEEIVDMKFLGDDENYLAVATNLEEVRVYDLASMSCSYVLTGHTDTVLSLDTCVSSSGKSLIVTGSKDSRVRLWEQESKCCIGVGTGHMGAVGAVAFSKKHKNFFVSGSSDRTLKVWSLNDIVEDAKEAINLKSKAVVAAHDKDINSVAIAPNDSLVCSGSQDRTACVWRLPELISVVVLKGHKRGIWSVEFSTVDQCVLTASGDKTIKIWAISDGSCLKTFEGHTSSVLRASFLTRGTQFVSSGSDGLVKLWTVKTNECIATYDQHEDKVWALAVGKKTEMLATGGGDAVVNLWHDSTAADKEEAFRKEVEKALRSLRKEEYQILFEYAREWNTKPKLCHVAQFLLFRVFNILPPTEILQVKGISEILEGLIPYSQRHFSRIDRLTRSTLLLDYTLSGMKVIEPETDLKVPTEDASSLQLLLESGTENGSEEQTQTFKPSKKRKSSKSRERTEKKVKETANTAIFLKA
ncbi:hypothetical protein GIB67_001995 [Kingdonia uniflora]|uniref:U3 small nucleolar RNA-associated protein 13 C-terminal domain-containing protein n=1 Tax=Kingdonia uniflora TaxID=39325 RepID=A0A7J7MA53_9MAGN|nr:hypothetical protein GIB67_001995 [Kingdonia uniflora]